MARLDGKVAIITGASSGIGEAAARRFAAEGAKLVLAARRPAELERVTDELGGETAFLAGDVRDEAYAEALVALAVERFGGLDIAFNNAGAVGVSGPLTGLAAEDWDWTIATNLTAAFYGAKHQAAAMAARGGGSILFSSSFVGAANGIPGMGAYAAAKAGLRGLVRTLAVELGPQRVRANALIIGGTDTPASSARQPDADPGVQAWMEQLHALKRLAEPEEIAEMALLLASDAASFVTGGAIAVDGGASITKT